MALVTTMNTERTEAHEYVRELTDAELVGLTVDLARRGNALQGQGIPVDIGAIVNHQIVGLLEAMAGPEVSMRVREWHLTWMDRYLDRLETEARVRMVGNLDLLNGADR